MSNNEITPQPPLPADASLEAALEDVSVELSRVEALDDTPASSVDQLEQNPPELGYYEAELESLRSAAETERP